MLTISDVANRAGVSKSSVSRVLNGNYQYMSEEMKLKILRAIEELNFVPNAVAQSLKKKETHVIGFVLAELAPFWSDLLKGVQAECNRNGYSLMISDSDMLPENEIKNIYMLKGRQVDGLIINTINPNSDVFKQLKEEKVPFVLVNSTTENVEVDEVVVDNISGTTEAIEYLIQMGHERIAIMFYPIENNMVREERLITYRSVLRKNGIAIDESLIQILQPEKGNGMKAALKLVASPKPPTAILSTNIHLTLEVLKAVRQANLEVPDDISVVGFDDFEWTSLLDPPLTTVAVSAFEVGTKAASLIIRKINRKREKPAQRIEIKPKLVIRGSAGKTSDLLPLVSTRNLTGNRLHIHSKNCQTF